MRSNSRDRRVEEYAVVEISIRPLSERCLLFVIFAVDCCVLRRFHRIEIPISCAPVWVWERVVTWILRWCLVCLHLILLIIWNLHITELRAHFSKLILMHLCTVKVRGVFYFHLFQLIIIFHNLLILKNHIILSLKQKSNFALITILFNTFNFFISNELLDLIFIFAFTLKLFN